MTPASGHPEARLRCAACGRDYAVEINRWRCDCGGVLDLDITYDRLPTLASLAARPPSMWRYAEVLPLVDRAAVSLGEGLTPLVAAADMSGVQLKIDYLMPTGSYKDRGAVLLAVLAGELGATAAIIDSSGNAGTAVAGYFARAGVPLEVFVPQATSAAKLEQVRAFGATARVIPGDRSAAAAAAREVADRPGCFYASHVYNPFFLHGTKTFGYEVWEQCGGRLPDTVVLPVGNGTLLLGCHLAFTELVQAGLAERMPALVGVQAAHCAPLAEAVRAGAAEPATIEPQPTVAEGVAIAQPPRGAQILSAVRASGGTVVAVSDEQVLAARAVLGAAGLYVEPTAALCVAAIAEARTTDTVTEGPWAVAAQHLRADDVVAPLTGSGLKSHD